MSCGESVLRIRRPAQRICVKCSFTQAASSSVVCTFQAGGLPHCWHRVLSRAFFPPGSMVIAWAVQLKGRLQPCNTVGTESFMACVGRGYPRWVHGAAGSWQCLLILLSWVCVCVPSVLGAGGVLSLLSLPCWRTQQQGGIFWVTRGGGTFHLFHPTVGHGHPEPFACGCTYLYLPPAVPFAPSVVCLLFCSCAAVCVDIAVG